MKFSLPIYTSLLALCLSESLVSVSASTSDDSLRIPLRKRSQSIHRDAFQHSRDLSSLNLPVCDFKELDRRLVQIERRYSNDQEDPKVLKHRKQFEEKWSDLTEMVEDFFNGTGTAKVGSTDESQFMKADHESNGRDSGSFFDIFKASDEGKATTVSKKAKTSKKQVKSDAATEKLSNQVSAGQDIEFFAQVTVGTPGQTFNVNPDSGSADFWVVSNKCQSKNCATKKEKFDSSKSSTYQANGNKDFSLTYGIGGVSGSFFEDNVSVAGVQIKNQTVAQASKLSKDYRTDQAEGVMGLGFRSIASGHEQPILQRLFSQHQFPKQILSFAFGRTSSGTVEKSELSIGSINQDLIKGDISYTSVTKEGFWQFEFDSLFVGASDGAKGIPGIVDSGTSSIAMPDKQAADFHAGVKGSKLNDEAGYYTFPCSQDINATFKLQDGTTFKLNPEDLNLGKETDGSSSCVSAIMPASTGGIVVFGLTLLKNAYTVLDYENKQIGFASYSF